MLLVEMMVNTIMLLVEMSTSGQWWAWIMEEVGTKYMKSSFSILTIPATHPEKSLLWSKEQRTPSKANKTRENGRWLGPVDDEAKEMGGKLLFSSSDCKPVKFTTFSSTIELFPSILSCDHFISKPPPWTAHTRPSEGKVRLVVMKLHFHLWLPVREKPPSTRNPIWASGKSSPYLQDCA